MPILVFVLVLVTTAGMRMTAIVTQVVADRTTRRATQSRANGRTRGATKAVADHGPASGAEATTNGGFSTIVFIRPDGAAGRTTHASTYRRTGAAAELPTNHVTQHTAQPTTDGRRTIAGSHGTLSHEQSQNQRSCS